MIRPNIGRLACKVFSIALLLGFPLVTAAEVRTWTRADGKTAEMELLRVDGETAVFSFSGKEIPMPLDKLSADDQAFVEEWMSKPAPAAGEPAVREVPTEWPESVEVSQEEIELTEEDTTAEDGDFVKVYKTKHFAFYSEAPLGIATMRDVARTFEATHKLLISLPLGVNPSPPASGRFIGELYQTRNSYISAGGPENSGGVYIGSEEKLMVPFPSIGLKAVGSSFRIDDDYDVNTIIHEITHQLMDSWLGVLPAWIVEGSAEYTSSMPYHAGKFRVSAMKSGVKDYIKDDMQAKASDAPPLVSIPKVYNMDYGEWSQAHGGGDRMREYYYTGFMMFYYFLHLRGEGDGADMLAYIAKVRELQEGWVKYETEIDAFLALPEVKSQPDGRFTFPGSMTPPSRPALIEEHGFDGAMRQLLKEHLYGDDPESVATDLEEKFKAIGVRF